MRKTPLLIPIILAICLGTLAYLIVAAIRANEPMTVEATTARPAAPAAYEPVPATEPEADQADEEAATEDATEAITAEPTPAPTPYEEADGRASEADIDRYFINDPIPPRQEPAAASRPIYTEDEDHDSDWENNTVAREIIADRTGDYIVLAGSFRQQRNAENQVAKLRTAGFAESEVSTSNGGAFAVAFVGRRSTLEEANSLKKQVEKKGFSARVVKQTED